MASIARTQYALSSIPARNKTTLDTFRKAMKETDSESVALEYRNKIVGYLYCMYDCSIITDLDRRILFTYYTL